MGIDGQLFLHEEKSGNTKQIIFSVKRGHARATHVRDLRGVIQREKTEIGIITVAQILKGSESRIPPLLG